MSGNTWNAAFQWKCQPEAEKICLELLSRSCELNPMIAKLQEDFIHLTSTRLFDWVDHLAVGYSSELEKKLSASGFVIESSGLNYKAYAHPGAQLPRVVMKDGHSSPLEVAIGVDNIGDFLMAQGIPARIEGTPLSRYRRCLACSHSSASLLVVERRVGWEMEPSYPEESSIGSYYQGKELWKTRSRGTQEQEDESMEQALSIASEIVSLVGRDMAAWIVLEVEREYWQRRNRAAQIQKNRQDHLGLGWANHDHHTFRSSRRQFIHLVRLFEMLGFYCRERFWAGDEAGWGAQVMENPRCKLVLFLDVDLQPDEINIDFAHQRLKEASCLGTVGLWCALHGDSILKGGMHHLEAQFLFENLKKDLSQRGVALMTPFSDFDYLKQAFTAPEMWKVAAEPIDKLLAEGKITEEQATKFRLEGAVGSHMENLQRREGYKGFNQKNVSFIIGETDPRKIGA